MLIICECLQLKYYEFETFVLRAMGLCCPDFPLAVMHHNASLKSKTYWVIYLPDFEQQPFS